MIKNYFLARTPDIGALPLINQLLIDPIEFIKFPFR